MADGLEEALTKLFVTELPPAATADDLRVAFEPFGVLDEVVVKQGGGPAGGLFGFVWCNRETAMKLMSQNHHIGGRLVPAPVLAKRQLRSGKDTSRVNLDPRSTPDKIFVGGLSNETTLDEFRVRPSLSLSSSHSGIPLGMTRHGELCAGVLFAVRCGQGRHDPDGSRDAALARLWLRGVRGPQLGHRRALSPLPRARRAQGAAAAGQMLCLSRDAA